MNRQIAIATDEAAIFSRVLEPEAATLSPAAARSILQLDFRPDDHRHMDELAAKARAGMLTKEEQEALDNYVRVGHLLAIMQSKARKSLKQRSRS